MQKVQGIGGIFLKARDPQQLARWYQQHLGVPLYPDSPYGSFHAKAQDETVWSTFAQDSNYFGRAEQQMMVNYRVADLDGRCQGRAEFPMGPARRPGHHMGERAARQ